jgi:hypothetical protein
MKERRKKEGKKEKEKGKTGTYCAWFHPWRYYLFHGSKVVKVNVKRSS